MDEAPTGAATGWRAHLVDDWRDCHKWWSLRMAAFGALLEALMLAFPDVLNALPQDMRDKFPTWFAMALPFAISLARVWRQRPKGVGDGGN